MVTIGLAIYIISVIGAILYIRYDSYYDEEYDGVLFIILCPALNSIVAICRLYTFFACISDKYLFKFNKCLIKLIKYKRK